MREEKRKKRVDKRQLLCLILGIAAAGAAFAANGNGGLKENRLRRNPYGEGEQTEEILVSGLGSAEQSLAVSLGEQEYERGEAEAAIGRAAEELTQVMLGENRSLNEVRSDLKLISASSVPGVLIEWESGDPALIRPDGEVLNETCPEQGIRTGLTARLTAGDFAEEIDYPVTVLAPLRSEEEKRAQAFQALLQEMDERQRTSEWLTLPDEYEGRTLSYRGVRNRDWLIFPFLGLFAAFLIPLWDRQKEEERKRERERQMMADYPEIVSRLTVFAGAGLPVRRAWERIVLDVQKDPAGKREAYREMEETYHRMKRGVPELQAYAEFGERCGLRAYRKLAGILEQNIKRGSEGIRTALEEEMSAAFEEKKARARRQGEEASTRLLLPLFLLLLIVMTVVSVPAFFSFGIG